MGTKGRAFDMISEGSTGGSGIFAAIRCTPEEVLERRRDDRSESSVAIRTQNLGFILCVTLSTAAAGLGASM